MSNHNRYGLIVRDKPKLSFQASRNVFGNDSESDDDSGKRSILLQTSSKMKRQSKISQEKAIKEDPTVYQYDEVYESMVNEKQKKITKNTIEKKPKYIDNLMKSANKRKLENERRVERQIQKEREKEGDEFADKDVFVTTAYKKKLEELRIEEEKEKYQDYLESIGDVTRQNDLGGFYRHLYEQKLGSDKKLEENADSENEPEGDKKNKQDVKSKVQEEPNSSKLSNKQAMQRNYRKRKTSKDNNLSEGEIEDSDGEIKFSNLDDIRTFKRTKAQNIDADSDFSIDDPSDNESNEKKEAESSIVIEKSEMKLVESMDKSVKEMTPIILKEEILKVDIWKKRTVGEVYDQALKRYYERKAARSA